MCEMANKIRKPKGITLKITLERIRPPIWRRILVLDSFTLFDLHELIQISMGWDNSHLHEFQVGERNYGVPDPEFDSFADILPEDQIMLRTVLGRGVKKFSYVYDFGDNWQHKIEIEKVEPVSPDSVYPCLLTGKRACPPDDIGGVWGYAEFLEGWKDPEHPSYEEYQEWVVEDFDPAVCDKDTINQLLVRWGRNYIG
ncbi:plasmid pRiA4b ORF-3 family protein [Magnetococcus marinus MC-1]|uniref:Plasmid pRiA4b ORF-3 family protein n=2 Tax=Magnetococcus TaxID=162171 RepID=A0LBS6_MAGMM|nr:plasmid pRiA4b ORF-3 family protein [Magnetococcus marinus MC-1]